jgi:hypothetical protein
MIDKHSSPKKLDSPLVWAIIVFTIGILTRLLMVLLYQPVSYSDTSSYRRLAGTVLQGFVKYDGTRTPGYPVFLALVGDDQRVWMVQLILGLATTMLLFYLGWKLTGQPWFGGLIALCHTLNLAQLFFESNLLTESLTTFLLVLTMTGMLFWLINPGHRRLWLAFLLGLSSTLTLLVRPLFIYLPFFLLFFLWIVPGTESQSTNQPAGDYQAGAKKTAFKFHWGSGIAFILPVILLLGGWLNFIHANFGDWSMTTMTGYHLIQHTGSFFEYVPDEYADLRDTYLQFRDAHIARYGTQTNTIWEAIPEMSRVSGYNFYELSRVLARLSIQLILKHPFLFLKSALSGWWMFWRTSAYWSADALSFPWLAGGIKLAIQIQRTILFFINLIFIFSSLYFVITECITALRHKPFNRIMQFTSPVRYVYMWLLLGIIWIASILQTLLDHGDNPRFLVPMQSLVILWVALFIFQLVRNKSTLVNSTAQNE